NFLAVYFFASFFFFIKFVFFHFNFLFLILRLWYKESSSPRTFLTDRSTTSLFLRVVYTLSISRKPVTESISGISEMGVSYARSLSTSNMELISFLVGVSGIEDALDASTKTEFSWTLALSAICDARLYSACLSIFLKMS